ncbi:MAG: PQQ-binding-like beta-propeller repeat protein [Planctomycetota bacterium]
MKALKSIRAISLIVMAFIMGVITASLLPGCGLPQSGTANGGEITATPASRTTASPGTGSGCPPIEPGDWPQWGGTSCRNNTPVASGIPVEWNVGEFDRGTGQWIPDEAAAIKWVAPVGGYTYGNPVIADGRVFVGTNNGQGYLARYPSDVDLGCLIAFDEETGEFLWQDSSEKLAVGRSRDWPLQGICCAPLVEGDRLWYVTNRGEVACLDTEGFHDGEDDGPIQNEPGRLFDIQQSDDSQTDVVGPATRSLEAGRLSDALRQRCATAGMKLPETARITTVTAGKQWRIDAEVNGIKRELQITLDDGGTLSAFKRITPADRREADTVWRFDMMGELGVKQHNMASCSVTAMGDILFVNTSNGIDSDHVTCPAPEAPSFLAMNKHTGDVLWTDNSPGKNILHGQWSSPAAATIEGVPQVIFCGGDGWLYSFRADKGTDGQPTLLWKFDANPKESEWILGGSGTRNNLIATPVIHDDLVYIAVGQDPEHGEGIGHLWCIDPTKRGDVSPTLAVKAKDKSKVIPHRREQAVKPELGEAAIPNPNSAAVWEYSKGDRDGDGEITFEEEMHRCCGTVAIKNNLLFVSDFSGLFHCIDAQTGNVHWTHDMLAAAWGSPLIVDDHVYIGDEDGDISIFDLTSTPHEPITEIYMGDSLYTTPVVANGVLFVATGSHVFAIAKE